MARVHACMRPHGHTRLYARLIRGSFGQGTRVRRARIRALAAWVVRSFGRALPINELIVNSGLMHAWTVDTNRARPALCTDRLLQLMHARAQASTRACASICNAHTDCSLRMCACIRTHACIHARTHELLAFIPHRVLATQACMHAWVSTRACRSGRAGG